MEYWYLHVIFVITILLFIPEVYKGLTRCFVLSGSWFYLCLKHLGTSCGCVKPRELPVGSNQNDVIIAQTDIKTAFPELKMARLTGFVKFKSGFPYIYRDRHVQLFETSLIVRDADDMRHYIKHRIRLLELRRMHQKKEQQRNYKQTADPIVSPQESSLDQSTDELSPEDMDASQEHDFLSFSHEQNNPQPTNVQSSSSAYSTKKTPSITKPISKVTLEDMGDIEINSHTFPPPKPLMIFNFSKGKVVNSRTPLSLKLVNIDTDIAYIQLSNDREFAIWTRHLIHNLKMELSMAWTKDAQRMHSRIRQVQKSSITASNQGQVN